MPKKKETADEGALTAQEYAFVAELLSGSTVKQAGDAVGIKERTAFEWKKKPRVAMAIAAGKEGHAKIVHEFQAERVRVILPDISKKLQDEAPKAIDIMIKIMQTGTKDDMVRLQAAKEIIRLAGITQSEKAIYSAESQGLSKEGAEQIRRQILGIDE